jgi:nicotinate-nucleotide adenylyltransferase
VSDVRPRAAVVPGSLGVFGGTFDPIHIGHLAVAEEAAEALGLERVLFVPAARPPHKPGVEFASGEDRLAMVELAIAGNPRFAASRIELDRPGPSYTVDTLAVLAQEGGAVGPGGEPEASDPADGPVATCTLHLVLSAEAFAGLPTWHEPRRVLTLARLVVAPRDGFPDASGASLSAWFPDLPEAATRAVFLDGPRLHLSASALRRRVAAGRSIRYLVPDAVRAHIEDHALYRAQRRNP